jgi:hypothetical protein
LVLSGRWSAHDSPVTVHLVTAFTNPTVLLPAAAWMWLTTDRVAENRGRPISCPALGYNHGFSPCPWATTPARRRRSAARSIPDPPPHPRRPATARSATRAAPSETASQLPQPDTSRHAATSSRRGSCAPVAMSGRSQHPGRTRLVAAAARSATRPPQGMNLSSPRPRSCSPGSKPENGRRVERSLRSCPGRPIRQPEQPRPFAPARSGNPQVLGRVRRAVR